MIEESNQAKTVPGARLVRILGNNFLKRSLSGTGVLFGDAALPFRESGDRVGVIRDRTGHGGSAAASDLFYAQVTGISMATSRRKLQRTDSLELGGDVNG